MTPVYGGSYQVLLTGANRLNWAYLFPGRPVASLPNCGGSSTAPPNSAFVRLFTHRERTTVSRTSNQLTSRDEIGITNPV